MSELLLSKISGVRQKHAGIAWATGLVAAAGAVFVLLGVGMVLDWWLDLPLTVRAVFLAVDLAIIIYIVVRYIALPILYGPDDEEIALWVEDAEPTFATRLIASIQFSRPDAVPAGSSVSLVRGMIRQAETLAAGIDFNNVVKTDQLMRFVITAGLALLVFGAGFAWGQHGEVSTTLLRRAFLSNIPVPRKTRIKVVSGNLTIPRGDTVQLVAHAEGSVPFSGEMHVKFTSGRSQTFNLNPNKDDATTFACTLDNVQDSFKYYVHLGDANSEWFTITTLPRPIATKLEVTQIYPEYTQMPNVNRALGDLTILEGSRLRISVTSNNPCKLIYGPKSEQNQIHLAGSERNVPLEVDPLDPHILHGEVEPPTGTTGFFVQLVDANGMVSKDSAVYRIDMVPDKPPVVRIIWPERKEELYTRVGRVRMVYEASDDYGLAGLTLKYRVDDGREQAVPLPLRGTQLSQRDKYEWDLAKVTPSSTTRPSLEGSSLEYWIEAVDNNNNKTGPGKGSSEHFSVRVVSDAEKRADIAARFSASVNELDEIKSNQEKINELMSKPLLQPK